jgi:hypothetical protein
LNFFFKIVHILKWKFWDVTPTGQGWEPWIEIGTINGSPGSDLDWRKSISEDLRLGAIPDNETETWRLARRAKVYLIHDDEYYRRSTSGILHRCIPIKEGKMLLLDTHKGVCGHHALSRSMVGKAFWQGFF